MNGIIYIFKNRKKYINKRNQFVALGVESVALRPTLVYVWETLIWGSHHGFPRFDQPKYKTFFRLFKTTSMKIKTYIAPIKRS